jgi:hypothetical protein
MSLDPQIIQALNSISLEMEYLTDPQNELSPSLSADALFFFSGLQNFLLELASTSEMAQLGNYGFGTVMFAAHGYVRGFLQNNPRPRPKFEALLDASYRRIGLRGFDTH